MNLSMNLLKKINFNKLGETTDKLLKKITGHDVRHINDTYDEGDPEYDQPPTTYHYIIDDKYPEEFYDLLTIGVEYNEKYEPVKFFASHDATPFPMPGLNSKQEAERMTRFLDVYPVDIKKITPKIFDEALANTYDPDQYE